MERKSESESESMSSTVYFIEVELDDEWYLVGVFATLSAAEAAKSARALPTKHAHTYWDDRSGDAAFMKQLNLACAHNELVISSMGVS